MSSQETFGIFGAPMLSAYDALALIKATSRSLASMIGPARKRTSPLQLLEIKY